MDKGAMLYALPAVAFIVISSMLSIRKTKRQLRERIVQAWGKRPEAPYEPVNIESIAGCFRNRRKANPDCFFIDDVTGR